MAGDDLADELLDAGVVLPAGLKPGALEAKDDPVRAGIDRLLVGADGLGAYRPEPVFRLGKGGLSRGPEVELDVGVRVGEAAGYGAGEQNLRAELDGAGSGQVAGDCEELAAAQRG